MTDEQLARALDGLFAYDTGSITSGIHDNGLKERVLKEVVKDTGPNSLYGPRIARYVREAFLSDDALAAGYGLEDAKKFIEWLDNELRGGSKP